MGESETFNDGSAIETPEKQDSHDHRDEGGHDSYQAGGKTITARHEAKEQRGDEGTENDGGEQMHYRDAFPRRFRTVSSVARRDFIVIFPTPNTAPLQRR
jgi:hypothetical protein